MTNSFLDVFGGTTIYPSDIGYIEYTLSQNTTLVWPDFGETSSNIAAKFIRVTAISGGLSYVLPDANKASVGNVLRFKNIGTNSFNIQTAGGSTIQTLTAGEDCLFSITDNTTSGGLWDTSQIGNGTTSANASSLAGNGLAISGTVLVASLPVIAFSSTPYVIPISGAANLYEWQGGLGTVLLPAANTVSNGWFTSIKNAGTGILTVSAAIDGSALTLQPGNQSVTVDSDGAAYHSYGYANFSAININSTYTKTLTTTSVSLTTTESQNNIISFAGTLTADTVVNFPNNAYIYDLTNSTSGSFNLTVQPSNGNGVIVPQGITRLVTNNASTMYFSDSISGSNIVTSTGLNSSTSGTTQTLSLANTTVTSGVYGDNRNYSIFTVNAQGQLTSALSIPFSGLTFTSITHVGTNTFSGTVTAPTVTAGDSSTKVATTAFVAANSVWSLIQTQTVTSSVVSVDFTSGINSSYRYYRVDAIGVLSNTTVPTILGSRFYQGGAFATSSFYSSAGAEFNSGGTNNLNATLQSGIILTNNDAGPNSINPATLSLEIFNPSATVTAQQMMWRVGWANSGNAPYYSIGAGFYFAPAAISTAGIQIYVANANVNSGIFSLWGKN